MSPEELNAKRKKAVELRLQGYKVAEVATLCGLSAPTVIAAFKAFTLGGWQAIAVKPRGAKVGQGSVLTADQKARIKEAMFDQPLVSLAELEQQLEGQVTRRTLSRQIEAWGLLAERFDPFTVTPKRSDFGRWVKLTLSPLLDRVNANLMMGGVRYLPNVLDNQKVYQLYVHDGKGQQYWRLSISPFVEQEMIDFFNALRSRHNSPVVVGLQGFAFEWVPNLLKSINQDTFRVLAMPERPGLAHSHTLSSTQPSSLHVNKGNRMSLTHLQRLEAESIHIMREVVSEAENPVMLYSVGKDSAVMLHLARKAFAPGPPPFPLLHVDTRFKFQEMYRFRDKMARESGMDLLVHINPDGVAKDINPFTHGSAIHTDIMKTEALKQALDQYKFDVAFGGARRDEEKSRAKERIFSFRDAHHRWDPKNQRPELWKLYNARKHKDETIRVFPISNWTELDIWQYIHLENIPIVPLYYSAVRPVVERDGALIMVDDERLPLKPGEVPMMRSVRFRTLGCYPLTGAVESTAATLPDIIQEMLLTHTSERQGRVIDHDSAASMEKKKQEGYF